MFPMAVLAPTPTTTARALPTTTIVPWKSKYIYSMALKKKKKIMVEISR
jgi:hypothetical protein